MDLELEQLLGVTRIVFYLGITFMLAVWYKPQPGANHHWPATIIATLIAGFSLALATVNILTWDTSRLATAKELLTTGFVGLWFFLTVLAGGNVAKMFRRRVTS